MSKLNEATPEQVEVLFAYVEYVKRERKEMQPMVMKAMLYDHQHGENEAAILLTKHLDEIISVEKHNLSADEIEELRAIAGEREDLGDLDDYANGIKH